uniref:uncharacterized protein LOC120342385 n=1 Tax=Styela clava TaxID=7725 RepID=UPI00193A42A2|nr:uncharacterized protein LOC120342385 [Styela clava]
MDSDKKTTEEAVSGNTESEPSPESITASSSDSWEKVDRHVVSGECCDEYVHLASKKDNVIESESQKLRCDEMLEYTSNESGTERKVSLPETHSAEKRRKYASRSFNRLSNDGHSNDAEESFLSSSTKKNGFGVIENNIFRPLQRIFYRKTTINEKSSLVNRDSRIEDDDDEVIMPQLPIPMSSSYNEKYGKLPEGIGTGRGVEKCNLDELKAEEGSTKKYQNTSYYRDASKGLVMAFLGAGVMYGLTAVFVRLAGENGVDAIEALFGRSMFQTILFGSVLLCKRVGWKPPPGRAVRCLLISIAYCIGTIGSYEAFDVIPPGAAVATRGAARTIFSIIFAYLVLREKVSSGDIVGLFCCFIGIALIITSGMTSGDKDYITPPGIGDNATIIRIYGYSLILASAIGRSLGHVAVRGARDDLNIFSVVFYHSALTFVFAGILLATVRKPTWPPSWTGAGYVAGTCLASSVGTFCSNLALKYAHPALVSFGQNADVVVSLTLQHLILQMAPKPMELCGVLTIFFGLAGLTFFKWFQSRRYNGEHERLK